MIFKREREAERNTERDKERERQRQRERNFFSFILSTDDLCDLDSEKNIIVNSRESVVTNDSSMTK